jgi:flagellar biosynthesis protein FlhF
MRIKTLTADKMTDALKLIREQLGPEALILETRKVHRNGQETLEVTAAVNEPEPLPRAQQPAVRTSQPQPEAKALPSLVASTLEAHGLPPELVATLATALPGLKTAGFTESEALAMLLGKQLRFLSPTEALPSGAAHVFVGPHGAGKTTLVAKLALQAKQRGQRLGLLSLDDQKIGGFEPLAIAAEIFGTEAYLIADQDDLRQAASKLAKVGAREGLLLDTAGLNPFAPKAVVGLKQRLQALGIPAQVHLVLPANLNAADMAMLPVACHALAPQSLIFTKLDCTTRYGALIATAAGSSLPLGLATHAADMATPPLALNATWLAEALLELPKQPWEYAQ